jgi:hypothetical protein
MIPKLSGLLAIFFENVYELSGLVHISFGRFEISDFTTMIISS